MPIIKVVKGDLLERFAEGEFMEIVHGCNCMHNMGAGIAAQIAKRYHQAVRADNLTPFADIRKLGTKSVADTEHGLIVNAYTQFYPGRENPQRLYDSITKVFELMNKETTKDSDWITGIPLIGAGLAGGDWNMIKHRINKATPKMNIVVVEYQPKR